MKLLALFLGFAKVGTLGFGGGYGMLSLIEAESVNSGWVTREQFIEGLAVGQALPGPISTKMAVYVGYHEAGPLGALSALAGVMAPSGVLMAGAGALLLRYHDRWFVKAALAGAKPVVVGMLAWVAWNMGRSHGITGWAGGIAAVLAFLALERGLHPAIVMVLGLGAGLVFFRA